MLGKKILFLHLELLQCFDQEALKHCLSWAIMNSLYLIYHSCQFHICE